MRSRKNYHRCGIREAKKKPLDGKYSRHKARVKAHRENRDDRHLICKSICQTVNNVCYQSRYWIAACVHNLIPPHISSFNVITYAICEGICSIILDDTGYPTVTRVIKWEDVDINTLSYLTRINKWMPFRIKSPLECLAEAAE